MSSNTEAMMRCAMHIARTFAKDQIKSKFDRQHPGSMVGYDIDRGAHHLRGTPILMISI